MAKRVTTIRLEDAERGIVAALAKATGRSESEVIRQIIPPAPWPAVFLDYAHLKQVDPLLSPELLMAEGLRRLMETSHLGIKREVLDTMAPDAVAELWLRWHDGLATHLGTKGVLGNRFKLEALELGHWPVPNVANAAPTVPPISMTQILDGLRMDEFEARLGAAVLLAKSFRAGLELAGETPEDIAHIIGPEFLVLLERAVVGDASAVDELERCITNDPKLARQTGPVPDPDAAPIESKAQR